MNAQRKVIKHFKHDYNDSTSLCNNNVWKIFEDKDNVLWFATNGGGLDKLNPMARALHITGTMMQTAEASHAMIFRTFSKTKR